MSRSWNSVPHVAQFNEADVTDLEEFRAELKVEAEKKGVKLTFLPFLLKACAKALKEYMPNMHLAVIYAKPRGLPLAGTYVEAITQDTWPVFPWDEEDKNNH